MDSSWPRIVDEQYQGDPFLKLVECAGQLYVLNEAAMIEQEERTYAEFARTFRSALPSFQKDRKDNDG